MSKAPPPPPEPRPRGGPAKSVAELLPDVGRVAFRKFGFVQSAVVSRWPEIVGPRYAQVSRPESIRFPHGKKADGVLTVLVRGAHAPMMQHIAPEIADRVNRFFGYQAVARVAIRQGDLPAAPAPRPAPPSLRQPPQEIGDSLRSIADPELRAVLSALAAGVAGTSGPPKIS